MADSEKAAAVEPPRDPFAPSESGLDAFGRPVDEPQERKKPGYNAADPKAIEAAKKEDGQRRRQDRDFWHHMMGSPERRAVFCRVLEACHIFGTYADLGAPGRQSDPYKTYFQAGEENVGKRMMLAAMSASTDLYLKMLKERDDREQRSRRDEQA